MDGFVRIFAIDKKVTMCHKWCTTILKICTIFKENVPKRLIFSHIFWYTEPKRLGTLSRILVHFSKIFGAFLRFVPKIRAVLVQSLGKHLKRILLSIYVKYLTKVCQYDTIVVLIKRRTYIIYEWAEYWVADWQTVAEATTITVWWWVGGVEAQSWGEQQDYTARGDRYTI